VDWQNSRLATDPIADEVAALKRVPGDGLLWVGGSDLAASFLEQGLMDELRIRFRVLENTSLGLPFICSFTGSSPGAVGQ
jgi:dihydrofolate reductase